MRKLWIIARAHRARFGAFAIACLAVLVPTFAQQEGPIQVNSQGVSISFQNTGGDATVSSGVGLSFQNTGGDATVSSGVGLSFQNTGGDATVSRGVSILFNNQGGNAVGSNGTTISFQNAQDARSGSGVTIGFTNSCILSCTATAPTTGAVGASISFGSTAGSSAPVTNCGGSVTYDWNFGDSTPHSTQPDPTHAYTSAGIYSWTLTTNVSGASACVRTGRITIDAPGQYCLTTSVSPAGAGTVTAGSCYSRGAFVSLQATPSSGYRFGYWSGDVTGTTTTPTENIQITRNKNLVANFVPVTTSFSGTIRIADGQSFWPLNGEGIICIRVTARPEGGGIPSEVNADPQTGTYTFTNLPPGVFVYSLKVAITYTDRITEDTSSLEDGCLNNLALPKTALYQATINITTDPDVYLPPPLVMVHGICGCYTKWYSPDQGNQNACSSPDLLFGEMWDNYARGQGFITFTPTYYWQQDSNHSWESLANQVRAQVERDLRSLSRQSNGGSYPPWVYIAHSQGGLVARVLTSGNSRTAKVVRAIQRLYLVGTPNSGAVSPYPSGVPFLCFTHAPYLQQEPMRNEGGFNATYDSFGIRDEVVTVFAGTKTFFPGERGIVGELSDGAVPVESVQNILRRFCFLGLCIDEPIRTFSGYSVTYNHTELGSAPSREVLSGLILPDITLASPLAKGRKVATSTSSTALGLRTVASWKRSLPSNQTDLVSFNISATDLLSIDVAIAAGSPVFSLIDPLGQPTDFDSLPAYAGLHRSDASGESFLLYNPHPGLWTLAAVAGSSAATYDLRVLERSPLGFDGFATSQAILSGQTTHLLGQWSGAVSAVSSPAVSAQITDEAGALVSNVMLFDDGVHGDAAAGDGVFGGDTPAFSNVGRHTVTLYAQGSYNGQPFQRSAEAKIDVIATSHMFTGDFSDGAYDSSDDGNYDTIEETVVVNVQAAGNYLVAADLEDAQGYFIGHAVGHLDATTAGAYSVSLDFSMSSVACTQFGSPFSIKNLTSSDAGSLKTLDIWANNVATQTFNGTLFACVAGTPTVTVTSVQPSAMFPGNSKQVIISGKSLQTGAQVSFGAGVAVPLVTFGSSTTLIAQVSVSDGATPGARDVIITNPDGHSSTGIALFNVASDQPPGVSINNVTDGQTITGNVTVSATATDDIGIQKVEFYLDGALQTSDTTFPYQFVWNTYGSSNAPHTLLAKAYDTANHTTNAQINVGVSCVATYSPSSLFFPLNGGSGSVNVSSAKACSWEVTTNDAWISITSAGIGNGNDVVTFEIRENFTASARTGTVSIGGKTVTIVQDGGLGEDCQYSISPLFTSFSASGGTGTIQVIAAERCAWQATTSDSFITITSGGIGIGNGTLTYTVGTNPGSLGRNGTITIGGQTFAVKQKGN